MTLAERTRRTRLAWEAGNREEALEAAMALADDLRDQVEAMQVAVSDGDPAAERTLERITPQLCALAERMAAE